MAARLFGKTCAMTPSHSDYAGGGQAYLRDDQYRDASRLSQRASLHQKYGTAETPWFDWIASQFDLRPGLDILEAGCGAGWLWRDTVVPIPAGTRLTLTDLSQGMIDEAVERATTTGDFTDVRGQVADPRRGFRHANN